MGEGHVPVLLIDKYVQLHHPQQKNGKFLKKVLKSGHIGQNIGHNTVAEYPQRIAEYLGLPNPKKYTGHLYRRTAATLLADSGCNIDVLRRAG